jgi:DNA recombination protein RmuC
MIFWSILSLLLGAAIGWLIAGSRAKSTLATLEERLRGKDAEISTARTQLASLQSDRDRLNSECTRLHASIAAAEERVLGEQRAVQQQLEQLQSLDKELREKLEAMTTKALRDNNRAFLELAEEKFTQHQKDADGALEQREKAVATLVQPVSDTLKKLDERVVGLAQTEDALLRETRALASALRSAHVRGRWGELQLKRIAELAGMLERCDFELQTTTEDSDGRRQRPDMIVRLPNGRAIIVDSKAPYDAYEQASILEDPQLRHAKLQEYAKQVRVQIDSLGNKAYAQQVSGAADFVVCFLPGESFFAAAISADPTLLEYAAQKNVVLASPSSLITLLRAVALGWREQQLAIDARHVCELGRELYSRLSKSADHFERLRKSLNGSVDAYNKLIGSMERTVFPQARKFKSLAMGGNDLVEIEQIEESARLLQSPDWVYTEDTPLLTDVEQ